MNEFYFYAESNGVKWYKCRRCQAAARNVIPAICPICKGKGKLLNAEPDADALKKLDAIAELLKPA